MRAKLLILLMTLACAHVCAEVRAQITLNVRNEQLREVFGQIEKQTGFEYDFFYPIEIMADAKPVTLKLKNVTLDEALKQCFSNQPLKYIIRNKTIAVMRKATDPPKAPAEKNTKPIPIKGKITDAKGQPIIGVSVRLKGSNTGTMSDKDGQYFIEAEETDVIIFSYIGYFTQELKINGKNEINVTLNENIGTLQEAVVKGYYTTTKELNTGNVSTVKATELARQPVGDVLHALADKVPGLLIQQQSGLPGAATRVSLRGRNSITNSSLNGVLYIIDGVPFNSQPLLLSALGGATSAYGGMSPFASLQMGDIERIEVLKDADATAIYGSRGANGVILITTKKGKAGKTSVTATVYSGVGKVASKLKLMNTEQYLAMRREALKNDNADVKPTDYDLNGAWGDVNKYTDWQKVMIGGSAKITDAQLAISGGSAYTQFRISGGFRNEGTVTPGDYRKQMVSSHLSISHQSENGRFNTGVQVGYVIDHNDLPNNDYFVQNILLAPNAPNIHNPDGTLNWQNSTWYNPFRYLAFTSKSETNNLTSAFNASYLAFKGFTVSVQGGFSAVRLNSSNLNPLRGMNPANPVDPSLRTNHFGYRDDKSWLIEPKLSYSTRLGNGKLEALVGMTFQDKKQTGLAQLASGFSSDEIIENIRAATTIKAAEQLDALYRYTALYARVGYVLNDKYMFNLTGNRDGSSRFGPGKRFGNFGSVGAGWIFSKEKIVNENLPFLSFGKVRASYGITGSDANSDYKYLSTYTPSLGNYQDIGGLNPTQLTNEDYHWESVKKFEAGIDLGFIEDKIMFNLSWYRNRTGNQLVSYPLPAITGFTSVLANLPAVVENTGIEMQLNTRTINSQSFQWNTAFNITIPRNRLVSFPGIETTSYSNLYAIGEPLSIAFRYQSIGVDPASHIYSFRDQNKDGLITSAYDRIPIFRGQQYFGGLNNNLRYKRFELDISLQFVKQVYTQYYSVTPPGVFFADAPNQLVSIMDDIRKGKAQKLTSNLASPASTAHTTYVFNSDGVIGDMSYIRVRNVSLSWEMAAKNVERLKLKTARIFLQGQNLFTLTNSKSFDPELQQLALPPLRVLTAGIQVGL